MVLSQGKRLVLFLHDEDFATASGFLILEHPCQTVAERWTVQVVP